jgi:hypothetical protein
MLCVISVAFSANAYSADKGKDYITKPFWNISKTYRADFKIKEIHEEGADCATDGTLEVGSDSIFKELSFNEEKKEMIVSFDYIKDESGDVNLPAIGTPYKLCISKTRDYKYRRAGGIDTGVLVIPYKVRSGDIFGDSTVGPYVAFKGDSISLLATFGLTQVSVSDINNADVKSETGLSAAVGLVWSVSDSFDIGLVVGKDHLSGEAGDNFRYQDKSWWSFSIGYNFTTN